MSQFETGRFETGRFEFDWVDAFSDRAFGGNGCAVVHAAAHLPEAVCTAYVRETSLVECTFTGPSDIADIKVRYFLASREIPFAGHPTIATVAAMRDRGLIGDGKVVLETGAGLVPVTIDGDLIEMTQVQPVFGICPDPELVAAAVSLPVEAIVGAPQKVSTGLPFCITVLRDQAALKAARLDLTALAKLGEALGADGIDMMEPFTGSATGAMAAYLWRHGLMSKDSFVAEQGHGLGRPGKARVTRIGSADDLQGVKVAGKGFVLMRGSVDLPDQL